MSIDADILGRMVAWRQDLHAHPELAFAEVRTGDLVARELAACGFEVHRGLGRTGVVGNRVEVSGWSWTVVYMTAPWLVGWYRRR